MELSPITVRVLGSLMEKARTTPEGYPLTLNSLVHACNQKTSRDPVTDYDDDEVLSALDELRESGLVMRVDLAGSRTAKSGRSWGATTPFFSFVPVVTMEIGITSDPVPAAVGTSTSGSRWPKTRLMPYISPIS